MREVGGQMAKTTRSWVLRLVVLVAGATLLAWPATGAAQDTNPLQLTLDEALLRAERHNPGYRQATGSLELNLLDNRDRWLDLLPQPQLSLLNTSMNWRRVTVVEDLFGNPLPNPEEQTVRTSQSQQRFGLNLSVDLGRFLQLRQQGDQAEVREFTVESQFHQLRSEVSRAFFDVQEQEIALELERQLLETAQRNRDMVRDLYALARRDRIDLVSLELDLAEQEHALDQSRAGVETARFALRNLIGDPELGEFELVPTELPEFDPEALDVEALVRVARSSSPQVLQAESSLRQEERSVDLVRAQWLPTLTFSYGNTRQGFVRGADAFMDFNPDGDWDRTVAIFVSFPDLGQYFRRSTQRRRAEVGVRAQRESLRQVTNELEQEVRTLVNELRATARSMEIQERRAELAAERLDLAREAYRRGAQTYLELQGAQEQAAQAGRQALAARYTFQRSRISLERALGMEIEALLELGGEG